MDEQVLEDFFKQDIEFWKKKKPNEIRNYTIEVNFKPARCSMYGLNTHKT